jgi:hypothetical protein
LEASPLSKNIRNKFIDVIQKSKADKWKSLTQQLRK